MYKKINISLDKQIENCLSNDLSNLLNEFETGTLTKDSLIGYFSEILMSANVDSRRIVNVLELPEFGSSGKEAALCIKINEGW